MDNTFSDNGSWGALFVPFPDTDTPPHGVTCAGAGTDLSGLGFGCVFDSQSDALINNTFIHNGFFGNPTNGDYGNLTLATKIPQNCFAGNTAPDGSTPSDLEAKHSACGPLTTSANFSLTPGTLGGELLCNTNIAGPGFCAPTDHYPRAGIVTMHPLPSNLPTMPNPCVGVPDNAWCRTGRPV